MTEGVNTKLNEITFFFVHRKYTDICHIVANPYH